MFLHSKVNNLCNDPLFKIYSILGYNLFYWTSCRTNHSPHEDPSLKTALLHNMLFFCPTDICNYDLIFLPEYYSLEIRNVFFYWLNNEVVKKLTSLRKWFLKNKEKTHFCTELCMRETLNKWKFCCSKLFLTFFAREWART